jgi:hypothetical protein
MSGQRGSYLAKRLGLPDHPEWIRRAAPRGAIDDPEHTETPGAGEMAAYHRVMTEEQREGVNVAEVECRWCATCGRRLNCATSCATR